MDAFYQVAKGTLKSFKIQLMLNLNVLGRGLRGTLGQT